MAPAAAVEELLGPPMVGYGVELELSTDMLELISLVEGGGEKNVKEVVVEDPEPADVICVED